MRNLGRSLIALMLLAPTAATAQHCGAAEYDHNGSAMTVFTCNGQVTITYTRPRSALRGSGVTPGTVLFQGRFVPQARTGDSTVDEVSELEGTAFVFRSGCAPAGYQVRGSFHAQIVLWGQAPVRGPDCRVRRYRNDELVFE